ncbi:UvrD/REP helicase N-terminal domain-containing protein [Nitrosomonas cryotolerans]|uniref:DNA 3'-5' helicase n=2 Tax=Nitrosomonas cryotolerans TaxID=44575 RepID=A0A1N6F6B4_9PROT|nr:UvrD/REP helicase N-terminal domain-containing protein [Nitrosomonas cryotolerans]SIN90734.1 UvrD/REP helicase N-terminal domain-containing protein [Nitrosomonas cryotolerans ATCC 49181]
MRCSINELEEKFRRTQDGSDSRTLGQLAHELTFRTTPRAKNLRQAIEKLTKNLPGQTDPVWRPQRILKLKPTNEQNKAIDAFLTGGSLKINAFAGTGKTSTLELLAHATTKQGQYIAFNKNIVNDARNKFPNTVNCFTIHGLAYRATPSSYKNNPNKMTGKINANQLAELLNLKKWRVDKNHILLPQSQGYLILETIRRFAQSADLEPKPSHVPRQGVFHAARESTQIIEDFAVHGAMHVWKRMLAIDDPIPLGHDGYLKLWALSKPIIGAEFILLDEAQDTSPVMLDVAKRQSAQMIYVGDKYQQIYEWRGAINAMNEIDTDNTTNLTNSFRFGGAIAAAATNILSLLGEKNAIVGNPEIKSMIGPTSPCAILARTNTMTIAAVIEALDSGKKPHLVGGKSELIEMLRGVQSLKNGEPSIVADFFGFNTWQQVTEFANSGEGGHLKAFVNLVELRGERKLLWALNRTVDEDSCDIIISTAHKSKGREWRNVRLMDDFLKSQPKRQGMAKEHRNTNGYDPAELRLFYVALTRAREEVEIAPNLMSLISSNVGTPPFHDSTPQAHKKRPDAPLKGTETKQYVNTATVTDFQARHTPLEGPSELSNNP